MATELVEYIQGELKKLGVTKPSQFVPDDDQLAAAVVDLFFRREEIKPPEDEEIDMFLGLTHHMDVGKNDLHRFRSLYEQLYNDTNFREQVLKVIFIRSQQELKESDARWSESVTTGLKKEVQQIDLVKIFGPDSFTPADFSSWVPPHAREHPVNELGAVRRFIEQKYPLMTPGTLCTFVSAADVLINEGWVGLDNEVMLDRLVVASLPQVLGTTVSLYEGYDVIRGKAGIFLAQRFLDLRPKELRKIEATPLKQEHQQVLSRLSASGFL